MQKHGDVTWKSFFVQGAFDKEFRPTDYKDLDMHIDPYTGYITWETGVSPYHVDKSPYPDVGMPRPTGIRHDPLRAETYDMRYMSSSTSPRSFFSGPNFGGLLTDPESTSNVSPDSVYYGSDRFGDLYCSAANDSDRPWCVSFH